MFFQRIVSCRVGCVVLFWRPWQEVCQLTVSALTLHAGLERIALQCERDVTAVRTLCFPPLPSSRLQPHFWRNKMSNLKESNTCPDGYRALNTSELTELLQNDDKMDQIIRLNEKVCFLSSAPQTTKVSGGIYAVLDALLNLYFYPTFFFNRWKWAFRCF